MRSAIRRARSTLSRASGQPVVATPAVMATTATLFYLTGAVVVALVAAQGSTPSRARPLLAGGAAAATLAGALVARKRQAIPAGALAYMNLAGTSLVGTLVMVAGAGHGADALAVLMVYVPLDSFFFFPMRTAVLQQAYGLAWLALLCTTGALPLIEVAAVGLVDCVAGVVVAWLVRAAAQAERDPLTGLPNGAGLARRAHLVDPAGTMAVGFLDVDHFDALAARLGPVAADRLLRNVAERLRRLAPAGVTVARYHADSFAVLFPGTDATVAGSHLDRWREELLTPGVTFSGGIADREPAESYSQLLTRARAATLDAKRGGRDRIVAVSGEHTARAELLAAIHAGQIEAHYQPIVSLLGPGPARVVGAEALARWRHPTRGLLGPPAFVPLAERTGLIGALGATVLEAACRDAAGWAPDRKVAVNASGRELADPELPARVAAALGASGLEPGRLVLEVTESTLDADDPGAVAALRELRALGVRVALDDFGTGYSSLARLEKLPIDILKLDRSFVEHLTPESRGAPIIEATCAMARALGLRVVAEGIEEPHQAALCAALGCEEGQGYLFGRPERRPAGLGGTGPGRLLAG